MKHDIPERLIRIGVAILHGGFHGVYRGVTGGYLLFGEYFKAVGIPFGTALATVITLGEILAMAGLLLNRGVFFACCWNAAVLIGGIIMVHAPNGWYVVGSGRNGVEFSVLLLVCYAALAWPHRPWRRAENKT